MKSFDLGIIAMVVVSIVWCIQWLKGLLGSALPKLKIPTWVWSIFMALVCVVIAFYTLGLAPGYAVIAALFLIACCELGYSIIVQSFSGVVQGLVGLVQGMLGGGTTPPPAAPTKP